MEPMISPVGAKCWHHGPMSNKAREGSRARLRGPGSRTFQGFTHVVPHPGCPVLTSTQMLTLASKPSPVPNQEVSRLQIPPVTQHSAQDPMSEPGGLRCLFSPTPSLSGRRNHGPKRSWALLLGRPPFYEGAGQRREPAGLSLAISPDKPSTAPSWGSLCVHLRARPPSLCRSQPTDILRSMYLSIFPHLSPTTGGSVRPVSCPQA